ncbi:pollen-specific leucine-rich repeat extensin-like protein 1 [Anoplophora glabripennis]|uniref:pollen-specific leucine-rich repeat extensin-like protein 1 n=1 Tax=Anoplophora glabripennis TaxID=217634 RepID=UPI00087525B6|nr:pollen-specific leucine-rich repeat extensin-like protein 1 [Anoplophora glabripennis]
MYRTDKQFMKNPATAPSRIYIGALPKTVIADDLEAKFKVHGNILGLVLNNGFAFIQFESEGEAQSAIRGENASILHGRKIVVKQALDRSKPGGQGLQRQGGPPSQPPIQMQKQGPPPPDTTKGPLPPVQPVNKQNNPPQKTPPPPVQPVQTKPSPAPPNEEPDRPLPFQAPDREPEPQDENMEDDRPNIRPPGPPQHNNDRGRKGGRKPIQHRGPERGGPRGRSNERNRFHERYEPGPQNMDMYREDTYYGMDDRDYMPPREMLPRSDSYASAPIMEAPPPPEKNDCEIIVVAKALTEYAEYIEQKLKNLGLVVDLLFPNEDVPIGKVLANISSRGCLYAILVMPQNEENRSLTLDILHGTPQEHRNMPVEDALILISRNFESYMKGEQFAPENAVTMSISDRHPNSIQMMLNLLAENRQLSSIQYDKIIKYMEDRRELQREFEVAEGIQPQDSQDSDPKQAELQNRILNILNKSNDSPIPTSITAPDPPPPQPNQAPILKDPTVQKALDSLLLGDMFKNMAGNA